MPGLNVHLTCQFHCPTICCKLILMNMRDWHHLQKSNTDKNMSCPIMSGMYGDIWYQLTFYHTIDYSAYDISFDLLGHNAQIRTQLKCHHDSFAPCCLDNCNFGAKKRRLEKLMFSSGREQRHPWIFWDGTQSWYHWKWIIDWYATVGNPWFEGQFSDGLRY